MLTYNYDGNLGLLFDEELLALYDQHGAPIHLTFAETRIMNHMLRNPGRTYSRAFLRESFMRNLTYDRGVDVVIKRLRGKLPDGRMIRTVTKHGYALTIGEPNAVDNSQATQRPTERDNIRP
jgi:DNA-binding response OmpR family regulator